jgi:hypothetical protein
MTWLLAQGEHLPVILVAIVVTVGICRVLFTPRESFSRLKAQVEDLAVEDRRHMGSVKDAHQRLDHLGREISDKVDRWIAAVHNDIVDLYRKRDKEEGDDT